MKKLKLITTLTSLAALTTTVATACSYVNSANSDSDANQLEAAKDIATINWITKTVLSSKDTDKIAASVLSDNSIIFSQYRDLRPCIDVTATFKSQETVGEEVIMTFTILIQAKAEASAKYTGSKTWDATYTYTNPTPIPPATEVTIVATGFASYIDRYDTTKFGTVKVMSGTEEIPLTEANFNVRTDNSFILDAVWTEGDSKVVLTPYGIGLVKLTITYTDTASGVSVIKEIPIYVGVDNIVKADYTTIRTLMEEDEFGNGNLIPGHKYEITDYEASVNSSMYSNVTVSTTGHFDVILTASSQTRFFSDAKVVQREGDTYFSNADLGAWTVKYDIFNDTDKYDWANSGGKGVIYYLKDEFANEASYDFKSLKFNNKFTFNASSSADASLNGKAYANTIASYTDVDATSGTAIRKLNEIVIDAAAGLSYGNTFAAGCSNITLGASCNGNKFGMNCYNITLAQYSSMNTFGKGCSSITVTQSGTALENGFVGNTFGNNCSDINFTITWNGTQGTQKYMMYNTFYQSITDVTVSGIEFSKNTIHAGVTAVTYNTGAYVEQDIYPSSTKLGEVIVKEHKKD